MMRVVVVGAGSFIAGALRAHPGAADWAFVGHDEALGGDAWLAGADVVLNCAFDARLKRAPYVPDHDIDLQLARRIRNRPALRYVMLSTRMVYGPAGVGGRLWEGARTQPANAYGIAKLETEQRLAGLLGDRLTILRLSNIFGFEWVPERSGFLAIALRSLRDHGRIVLDMSPFVERDFLPVEALVERLVAILGGLRGGLYNLGAGYGTPTGRIAQWLIEGYGGGELLVTDVRDHDGFWLDIAAAREAFGTALLEPLQLRSRCVQLGRRLRAGAEGYA